MKELVINGVKYSLTDPQFEYMSQMLEAIDKISDLVYPGEDSIKQELRDPIINPNGYGNVIDYKPELDLLMQYTNLNQENISKFKKISSSAYSSGRKSEASSIKKDLDSATSDYSKILVPLVERMTQLPVPEGLEIKGWYAASAERSIYYPSSSNEGHMLYSVTFAYPCLGKPSNLSKERKSDPAAKEAKPAPDAPTVKEAKPAPQAEGAPAAQPAASADQRSIGARPSLGSEDRPKPNLNTGERAIPAPGYPNVWIIYVGDLPKYHQNRAGERLPFDPKPKFTRDWQYRNSP
jgi:hypothetical protein